MLKDTHFSKEVLLTLAPSLGYFGGAEVDLLKVNIGFSVVSIKLRLDSEKPTWLNLKGIEFRDQQGNKIKLDPNNYETKQSSYQIGKVDQKASHLLERKSIHTDKQICPWWEIRFLSPLHIQEMKLWNRPDKWGKRSQPLVIEAYCEKGNVHRIYRGISNETLKNVLIVFNKIFDFSKIDMHELSITGAKKLRADILQKLNQVAKNLPADITARNWSKLLSLTSVWTNKEPDNTDLSLMAATLITQKKEFPNFATTLKMFGGCLNSRFLLQDFEDQLNQLAHKHKQGEFMLSRHGLHPSKKLRKQADAYLQLLDKVIKSIAALDYKVVIAYGTLLGAVREGRFLAHDDDVDILYLAKSTNLQTVKKEIIYLKNQLECAGFHAKILLPEFLNMHISDDIAKIDVFPCWIEGRELFLHMESMRIRSINPELIFPASKIMLEDMSFPAPADPQYFLRERYGCGWKLSDPYYNWPWALVDAKATAKTSHIIDNEKIQLNWWTHAPNFGDLLSPWLIKKLSGREIQHNDGKDITNPPLLAIGSIAKYATKGAMVWGSGLFGDEVKNQLCRNAHYLAVRGPLTRNLLRIHKIPCPEVYGDPALLLPLVYATKRYKKYALGIIFRWSEKQWENVEFGEGVRRIYLGTEAIESVLDAILECENILSSSLHGLILADAYNIPNAWLDSNTPKGLNFKYYDYFLSVEKLQKPQKMPALKPVMQLKDLLPAFDFNDQKIKIDLQLLLA